MEYDTTTAAHYAGWRPPLHAQILALGLREDECFTRGLDVGCGTGHSTRALKRYCDEAVGIDPSAAMIATAPTGGDVRFVVQSRGDGVIDQGFSDGSFDLFSFAGSLYYQDPGKTLEEISWLAEDAATVLVYDFDVLVGPVFERMGWELPESDYDHQKTFSPNDAMNFSLAAKVETELSFDCTPAELAHLLLSVKSWRETALAGIDYEEEVARLSHEFGPQLTLTARAYLTRFAFG